MQIVSDEHHNYGNEFAVSGLWKKKSLQKLQFCNAALQTSVWGLAGKAACNFPLSHRSASFVWEGVEEVGMGIFC